MHYIRMLAVTIDNNGNVTGGSGFANPNTSIGTIIQKGVNVFAFVIGAISVIMVLVGALRYVLSAGNPQATNDAKNTILYAVIGVVIAFAALAIVRFVTGAITL
ncbi:MAG TPA: hypothetical protein VLE72_03590 [Candidatus Saccharimonadales bacterium]|nr:hypothetical protein [Candidatus Saccharimonadales bacterium]